MSKQPSKPASTQDSLPDGWRMVRFDEIADNIGDRVDPTESDAERYVGLEHLDSESLKIRRWGTPDDVIGQKLAFREGDIIFGRRRAYQRKLAVADFEGICSAHAMVVRAQEGAVVKDFLPFFMQSDMFMERAMEISVGSLSPTINWKTLRLQEFPLPPEDEQHRIAEMLWAAYETVESYIHAADHGERSRRVLLTQLMKGTAGGNGSKATPLGNLPSDWQVRRVGGAGEVQLGRQRAPKYQTGKHSKPYLRVANVFDGYFDLDDVLSMDFDESDFATYHLRPGDILLNEGQSRELVGRCALYSGEIEDCCFQNTLVRFRPSDDLLPEFAFAYFQYAFYKGVFAAIASQTTSIAHLGADRFAGLYMPIPPRREQERIVDIVNTATLQRDHIRDHLLRVQRVSATLRESLLSGTRD